MGLFRTLVTVTLLVGLTAAAFIVAQVLCEDEEELAEEAD